MDLLCCSQSRAGLPVRAPCGREIAGPQKLPRPRGTSAPSKASTASPLAVLTRGPGVPLGAAAEVRGGSAAVPGASPSPRHAQRDWASFAHGPPMPCTARAAGAKRGLAWRDRVPWVTFFGETKKVTRRRARSGTSRSEMKLPSRSGSLRQRRAASPLHHRIPAQRTPARLCVIHDRRRKVDPDDATGLALVRRACEPRRMDLPRVESSQFR
jgi:hypothetical protein